MNRISFLAKIVPRSVICLASVAALYTTGIHPLSAEDHDMPKTKTSDHTPAALFAETCCPIVELRQYSLHPGQRDVLIELFDSEFVESQESLGMKIIGQFRDLDKPDRFVWLRGFRDMPARAVALKSFYGGPVWKAHSKAANATMIDSDNVLLLRPVSAGSGFSLANKARPAPGATKAPDALIVATVYYFGSLDEAADFASLFERTIKPIASSNGASILAYFMTESSANTFPALPVREGEHVLVWFAGFRDSAAYEKYETALAQSPQWRSSVSEELQSRLKGLPEILRLSPTARSLIRE